MSNLHLAMFAGAVLLLGACACGTGVSSPQGDNPITGEWSGRFGAPPFDQIREAHFKPAFAEAMEKHKQEIAAIVSKPEAPTFANTIEALDQSGRLLDRVRLLFLNLNDAHTSDGLQALAKEVNPQLTQHQDDILMNQALFERVKVVYEQRQELELSGEQRQLLDKRYKQFVRGGANLDEQAKSRLRQLNSEIATLTTQFGDNLIKEMNAVALLVEDEADLDGLPQSLRDAAAALAAAQGHEGAWGFNLTRTSWTPFMQLSERRDLRQELYTAYTQLGMAESYEIAAQIAAMRAERAQLLGYESHAAYVLEENMAERPQRVNELLDKLWTPALARAKAEKAELRELAGHEIAMWDWWYYAEKLRAVKYDFDNASVKPYLQLDKVRQAAFDVAGKLWGISFEKQDDIPVYHEDVEAYEVKDADGAHLGLFYVDYFARDSKRDGAWMESYRQQWQQDGQEVRPILVNVCNFTKAQEGQPNLISPDQASTLFHEFGHGLHGLLADGHYASLSGTNVARDFVELPSQIMENWAFAPEVLQDYARHYQTGEVIPEELVKKLEQASHFNQGFATTEYLAASILDMAWHSQTDTNKQDAVAFEDAVMQRIGMIPEIVSRYRTGYFRHIFSGEYSAGYYSYIWAEVLDADGFQAFEKAGLFDQETASSFRKNILAAGASDLPMELYKRFRGAEPGIEPLLKKRGLQ
jgi:peptidyl-dipeptidase Dcp